jgi:hypothetical protein
MFGLLSSFSLAYDHTSLTHSDGGPSSLGRGRNLWSSGILRWVWVRVGMVSGKVDGVSEAERKGDSSELMKGKQKAFRKSDLLSCMNDCCKRKGPQMPVSKNLGEYVCLGIGFITESVLVCMYSRKYSPTCSCYSKLESQHSLCLRRMDSELLVLLCTTQKTSGFMISILLQFASSKTRRGALTTEANPNVE